MNIFKRGAAILAIVALILSFSGCVNPNPDTVTPTPTSAPGAQVIPIPIPSNYIGANAITDLQLGGNAIPYNVTTSSVGLNITGTVMTAINNNGSITVNRTSLVVVRWDGEIGVNGTNSAYMVIQIGGINASISPVIVATNANVTLPSFGTRAVFVMNASLPAGTYSIVPFANASTASAVTTIGRSIMITNAYPHS